MKKTVRPVTHFRGIRRQTSSKY